MLVSLRAGNFRSFHAPVELSMEAADIASLPASLDVENVFEAGDGLRLLTSAAIYGANASGKSNLIRALGFMRSMVRNSAHSMDPEAPIDVEPFRLSDESEREPTLFEAIFYAGGGCYRYGFTVTRQAVVREWLYQIGERRERTLFTRADGTIAVSARNFREGRRLEERTRENALFLSVVRQFDGEVATAIVRWFDAMTVEQGLNQYHWTDDSVRDALQHFQDPAYQRAIIELIRRFDTGIDTIELQEIPGSERQSQPALLVLKTLHRKYALDGAAALREELNMWVHESDGTQRLFMLAYPLLRALREGGVLVIDELDARLHPNLVTELVRLFNSRVTNPRHAQLIFTTHSTHLLSAKLFRRDQIWFVEKSRRGVSDLFSLIEYRAQGKLIRNDASYEKDYVGGRYGAVPYIRELREIWET